jgi:hypothetical protein
VAPRVPVTEEATAWRYPDRSLSAL